MVFEIIIEEIKDKLKHVLLYYKIDYRDINIEITEPHLKEYGDFSSNLAFILSKILKKNPFEIAKDIVNNILPNINSKTNEKSLIKQITIEKPGFINFTIELGKFLLIFFSNIDSITKIPYYDNVKEGILIEHTSVNPNKALHVGHIRNAVIGDCLYRLFSLTGHNVKVLNYVDDSGLQVADIIVALKFANIPSEAINEGSIIKKFDHYCGNYVYVKINEMYPDRPDLETKRKYVLKELENPDSEITEYTQKIVKRVLRDQLETVWNLRCHYDILNFESQIIQSSLWDSIFKILKEKQIIRFETSGKNSGCWVFKSKTDGDKVLVRSDKTTTYFAKDIPYAMWKLGYTKNPFELECFTQQWDNTYLYQTTIKNKNKEISNTHNFIDTNVKKVITIIDSRQERLQSLLVEILTSLGFEKTKYDYLGYEPVTMSNKTAEIYGFNTKNKKSTHMSGRKGIFIEADAVIDILVKKTYQEICKRNDKIHETEIHERAKEIAVSAIRYYFIKHDLGKTITFDINDSLSLEGDTGPYIQYSYARGKKIYNKLESKNLFVDTSKLTDLSLTLSEIELIKHLCKFPTTIKESVNNTNTKLVARFLFTLSTLFNNFYEGSPILKESGVKKNTRIKILDSTLIIMEHCMKIIGMTPLEQM
jgi:arginyl-tRNA synthetase